jgi:hypothetical protein
MRSSIGTIQAIPVEKAVSVLRSNLRGGLLTGGLLIASAGVREIARRKRPASSNDQAHHPMGQVDQKVGWKIFSYTPKVMHKVPSSRRRNPVSMVSSFVKQGQMPELPVSDRNALRKALETIGESKFDTSPSTLICLLHYLTNHRGDFGGEATSRLIAAMQSFGSTPGSKRLAELARTRAASIGDDQLTAALSRFEDDFLHFLSSGTLPRKVILRRVAKLEDLANTLEQHDDSRRQSSARFLLASYLVVLRRYEHATEQMRLALQLFANAFNSADVRRVLETTPAWQQGETAATVR